MLIQQCRNTYMSDNNTSLNKATYYFLLHSQRVFILLVWNWVCMFAKVREYHFTLVMCWCRIRGSCRQCFAQDVQALRRMGERIVGSHRLLNIHFRPLCITRRVSDIDCTLVSFNLHQDLTSCDPIDQASLAVAQLY